MKEIIEQLRAKRQELKNQVKKLEKEIENTESGDTYYGDDDAEYERLEALYTSASIRIQDKAIPELQEKIEIIESAIKDLKKI